MPKFLVEWEVACYGTTTVEAETKEEALSSFEYDIHPGDLVSTEPTDFELTSWYVYPDEDAQVS